MKTPWIAWSFTDLFASRKYARMTAVQQAIYFAMLGEQATGGPLPRDPDELAYISTRHTRGLSEQDFHEAWAAPLTECFVERDGRLVNERLALELELAEARSANARKAIQARWDRAKEGRKADSDTPVSREKNDRTTITEQDTSVHDSNSPLTPPPGGEPEKPKRRKAEPQGPLIDAALQELGYTETWIRELAMEWAALREDPAAKARRVSAKTWKANIKKLYGFGEAVARSLVDDMVCGDWMAPVWANAQQAGSQGASGQRPRYTTAAERRSADETLLRDFGDIEQRTPRGSDEVYAWAWERGHKLAPVVDPEEAYKGRPVQRPEPLRLNGAKPQPWLLPEKFDNPEPF